MSFPTTASVWELQNWRRTHCDIPNTSVVFWSGPLLEPCDIVIQGFQQLRCIFTLLISVHILYAELAIVCHAVTISIRI